MSEANTETPLARLVGLLQLETAGQDRFRGHSENIGTPAVFGGQVLAQAHMAACLTVPGERVAHSLHAYFLLPGRHAPIDYQVERVRDGGSFSTRRVVAMQDEQPIFEVLASFQARAAGIDRHDPMPPVPGPEGIPSELQQLRKVIDWVPAPMREILVTAGAIEYRPLVPYELVEPTPREARSSIWLRATGTLPAALPLHQSLLAYASDHGLLRTATLPHALSYLRGDVRVASLDHAMWFHRDFRIDDWLLFQVESPSVVGGRAIARGVFYSRDGRLVASAVQEGIMRTPAGRHG
ncbi:MAG: acyl-CoA thioesterase II [Rhodocyclaceae bacterium]|nr:acyl-CoA thioesterase II [Rhodocyclaceae bacterium]MBK7814847.1 acyl-CoA thioesterase II [Rhodocyclaceae bacterium]